MLGLVEIVVCAGIVVAEELNIVVEIKFERDGRVEFLRLYKVNEEEGEGDSKEPEN